MIHLSISKNNLNQVSPKNALQRVNYMRPLTGIEPPEVAIAEKFFRDIYFQITYDYPNKSLVIADKKLQDLKFVVCDFVKQNFYACVVSKRVLFRFVKSESNIGELCNFRKLVKSSGRYGTREQREHTNLLSFNILYAAIKKYSLYYTKKKLRGIVV